MIRPTMAMISSAMRAPHALTQASDQAFDALLDSRGTDAGSNQTTAQFRERGVFGLHGATAMPEPASPASGAPLATADASAPAPEAAGAAYPPSTAPVRPPIGGDRPIPIEPAPHHPEFAPRLMSRSQSVAEAIAAYEQPAQRNPDRPAEGRSGLRAAVLAKLLLKQNPSAAGPLTVAGSDDSLNIVAHAAAGQMDAAEIKRRAQAIAREFGMTVAEFRFNDFGQSAPKPAGGIHGNRPR